MAFADPDGKDEFERIQFYDEKGNLIATAYKLVREGYYMFGGKHADVNVGEKNKWI